MNALFQKYSWVIVALGIAIGFMLAAFAWNLHIMLDEISNIGTGGFLLFLLAGVEIQKFDPNPTHDTTKAVLDEW